jgi:hypothetical protein
MTGVGVSGYSASGSAGMLGTSASGIGVKGSSTSGSAGVYGESKAATASGVEGHATGAQAAGVYGTNPTGFGVLGTSGSGTAGVYGQSNGAGGSGVAGYANGSATSAGVYGRSSNVLAVWGRNEAGGTAMKAEGNAVQSRDKGGWVKAMAYIDPHQPPGQAILRCYNSQASAALASTPSCGFAFTYHSLGQYIIDFGFQVDDRFIVVTAEYDAGDIVANTDRYSGLTANQVWVGTVYSATDNSTNAPFVIIVY